MVDNITLERFFRLFRGSESGYNINHVEGLSVESQGSKQKTLIKSVKEPVTREVYRAHLDGKYGVGICPVCKDGKCVYAVIDIDDYDKVKLEYVLCFIKEYSLRFVPFSSKSGGLHLYVFFVRPEPARDVRRVLEEYCTYMGLYARFGNMKVEIFPKQTSISEGGMGSCILLPYFGGGERDVVLNGARDYGGLREFMTASIKLMTSVNELEQDMGRLPYSDAPPCLQSILNGGDCIQMRNNMLFSYSVYAKKRFGDGFEKYAEDVNKSLSVPLSEEEVRSITESVSKKEYAYKCNDAPCKEFCNKSVCKLREYGLGKDKGHFTGVDYGELTRYMSAEPYYIWKLRLQGTEEWKDVLFRDETVLLEQKNFAKLCIRYLNTAPMRVSDNDWYAVLNTVLPNIKEEKVSVETDTSRVSQLKAYFISYIANRQARRSTPYQIRVGLCVKQGDRYYFTSGGFIDYLLSRHVPYDAMTMRELLKSFGAIEDVLSFVNSVGRDERVTCWSVGTCKEIEELYHVYEELENDGTVSGNGKGLDEGNGGTGSGEDIPF